MKDKLLKNGSKIRLNPIEVIRSCLANDHFYFWMKERDVLNIEPRITSLKRLARIFLSENPGYYTKFVKDERTLEENIRIAKTPWLDKD